MTHRVTVELDDEAYERATAAAREDGRDLSDWLERLIGDSCREPAGGRKDLEAIFAEARKYEFPAPPIDQMLREIDLGRA